MLHFALRSAAHRVGAVALSLAAVRCTTPADIVAAELAREEALHYATDPSPPLTAPNAFKLAANGAQVYECQANADGSTHWVIRAAQSGATERACLVNIAQGTRAETPDGLMPDGTCTPGATAKVEYTTLLASSESGRKR